MHRTTLLQNCPELIDKVDYLLREEWPSSNAVIKVTRDVRKFPVRFVCVTSRGELVGHVKTMGIEVRWKHDDTKAHAHGQEDP